MIHRRIVRRPALQPANELPATLHPVLRRVYAARGLHRADQLDLGLERLLPVGSLGGVPAAVELLVRCHRDGRRVLVLGDFDADGATSTALMVRQLRRLGFQDPQFLVPDRFRFGYGLTPEIVRVAAQMRPDLIVTVDNGVSSVEGVAEARRLGIDVLVTDHHLPGPTLPDAAAIVNPNLPGEPFASKALAGVGVAFYVMAALTRMLRERGALSDPAAVNPADLLDLVALGTVADVVPLDLNNRILVAQGLRRIRAGRCVPGLVALLEAAGRRPDGAIAQDLGFQVGPRLNAAGRLEDMTLGIECLLTADPAEARRLAGRLAELNAERREIEARMQGEALAQVDALVARLEGSLPAGLCLYEEGWHQGVIGLVASRVKERVHRPVIAFAPADDGWVKGSARSVPGLHVRTCAMRARPIIRGCWRSSVGTPWRPA
jgi:single-stranded-DNA-specific exonuclease